MIKRLFKSTLKREALARRIVPHLPESIMWERCFARALSGDSRSELQALRERMLMLAIANKGRICSQLGQDIFALAVKAQAGGGAGYFVEFGATDGKSLSNTCLLEKEYGWPGLLAEPNPVWHPDLGKNRDCAIDHACVAEVTGLTVNFLQTEIPEFATIEKYRDADIRSPFRQAACSDISMTTLSLNDLLERHNAPEYIDFLSVDTEGSEFDILKTFDFSRHQFAAIAVEHNYSEQRDAIQELLGIQGYQRVFSSISRWDDWYISV